MAVDWATGDIPLLCDNKIDVIIDDKITSHSNVCPLLTNHHYYSTLSSDWLGRMRAVPFHAFKAITVSANKIVFVNGFIEEIHLINVEKSGVTL